MSDAARAKAHLIVALLDERDDPGIVRGVIAEALDAFAAEQTAQEAAKHADCCVDRQEMAQMTARAERAEALAAEAAMPVLETQAGIDAIRVIFECRWRSRMEADERRAERAEAQVEAAAKHAEMWHERAMRQESRGRAWILGGVSLGILIALPWVRR